MKKMKYYIFYQRGNFYEIEEKEFLDLEELFRHCYYMGEDVLVVDRSGEEKSVLKKLKKYLFLCSIHGKKDVISRIVECVAHNLGLERDLRKTVQGIFASVSRMGGRAVKIFVIYIPPEERYYSVWRYKYSLKTRQLTVYRTGYPILFYSVHLQFLVTLTKYPKAGIKFVIRKRRK